MFSHRRHRDSGAGAALAVQGVCAGQRGGHAPPPLQGGHRPRPLHLLQAGARGAALRLQPCNFALLPTWPADVQSKENLHQHSRKEWHRMVELLTRSWQTWCWQHCASCISCIGFHTRCFLWRRWRCWAARSAPCPSRAWAPPSGSRCRCSWRSRPAPGEDPFQHSVTSHNLGTTAARCLAPWSRHKSQVGQILQICLGCKAQGFTAAGHNDIAVGCKRFLTAITQPSRLTTSLLPRM
jgi:hypothetical protein